MLGDRIVAVRFLALAPTPWPRLPCRGGVCFETQSLKDSVARAEPTHSAPLRYKVGF